MNKAINNMHDDDESTDEESYGNRELVDRRHRMHCFSSVKPMLLNILLHRTHCNMQQVNDSMHGLL